MKIVGVSSWKKHRYIPFRDWNVPKRLLTNYLREGGDAPLKAIELSSPKKSSLTRWLRNIRDEDLPKESNPQLSDQAVRIIGEAEASLRKDGLEWQDRLYREVEGKGKDTVSLSVVEGIDSLYGFGLHSVFNGDSDEVSLASQEGLSRGLMSVGFTVETDVLQGNRFSFDYGLLVTLFYRSVGDYFDVSGRDIVGALLDGNQNGTATSQPRVCIMSKDGVAIMVGPECVGDRFENRTGAARGNGKPRDVWEGKGGVLTGPLKSDVGGDGYRRPSFLIEVAMIRGGIKLLDRMTVFKTEQPLFTPQEQVLITSYSKTIANALQG